MARALRIEFPGAFYHVTARGNGRSDIFADDQDREHLLRLLSEVCQRFSVSCHAYCLMNNHYHLALETDEPNLSRALRHLNGVYTQRFNRRHGHVGHIFQGRYKAILVDRDAYYLEVVRYILLNPVRAGLVGRPMEWKWSSYRAIMGQSSGIDGLDMDRLLLCFGASAEQARPAFARFIEQGAGQPCIWNNLVGQIYLGEPAFAERMHEKVQRQSASPEVPRSQRRVPVLPLAEYRSRYPDRNEAMASAYASGCYTMHAIAQHFGVHYATVSRAVRKTACRNV